MQGNGQWKDLETLLLLEGIELYGDNWADIAAHVGTKSQVSVRLSQAHPLDLKMSC